MSPARAREIIAAARARATFGPWSDQLDAVMSKEERADVKAEWDRLPGWYSFAWTLQAIARRPTESEAADAYCSSHAAIDPGGE